MFSRAKPRTTVLSHITLIGDANNPVPGDEEIEARARTSWSGNLVVGTDLTRFVLTADAVLTNRFDHARGAYEKCLWSKSREPAAWLDISWPEGAGLGDISSR